MEQEYNGWTNFATWRVYQDLFADIKDKQEADDRFDNLAAFRPVKDKSTEELVISGDIDKLAAICDEVKDYVNWYIAGAEESPEKYGGTDTALDWARLFVSDANWAEIARGLADIK